MRLSELIGGMSPGTYSVIALVMLVGVFTGILYFTFRPSAREEQRRALELPLQDGDER